MIKERLKELRSLMEKNGFDGYLITDNDYHGSEYLSDYFKTRKYISGFTGSAGTVVVLMDRAGLWTDGRYFLQAEKQLEGSGIDLYKIGEEGVETVFEFIEANIKEGQVIAFDGKTVSAKDGKELSEKGIKVVYKKDLIGEIWKERPLFPQERAFDLGIDYSGESRESKIQRVKSAMEDWRADYHILTTLDDIGWLLNIRGGDVKYTPVLLSYVVISAEKVILFAMEKSVKDISCEGIEIREYSAFDDYIKTLKGKILVDTRKINYFIYQNISSETIVDKPNPTTLMKAIKNHVEIENMRKAHIKDGIAVTKFICWLKNNVGKGHIDEISAAEKLEGFRREQENYIGNSFAPILGYKAHGAIIHYSATKDSNINLEPESFVLIDTGGQYLEGTTDVTRTVALGNITKRQKEHYTAVLLGNLRLANGKFAKNVTGKELDQIARGPINKLGLDYNHGTGHGVGYLLSVHEGPQTISKKATDEQDFLPGMITSDEPGVYIEGEYGIRLETLILCKEYEDKETENNKSLAFETLTMVPWDMEAVEVSMLSEEEKSWLNSYQQRVRNVIYPYLTKEEKKQFDCWF